MPIPVTIPTPLRNLTGGLDTIEIEAGTVADMIAALEQAHPGMKNRLCDDAGNLRRFVNIYVNGEDVRFLDDQATAIKQGDEVSIVPAIAGG
jgi:molybdopterin synthase sulfur carrier subunit